MFRIGEVERGFIDARGLQDVDVSGEQGKGDGAGNVDARILKLAFDEDSDRDEAAGGRLGEVSGSLVDAYGADDLLGLGDLVHLREGGPTRQGRGTKNRAEEESSHRSANEFRRYLRGKVPVGVSVGRELGEMAPAVIGYTSKHGLCAAAGREGTVDRIWAAEAVGHISFHINAGETLGLVGESGSGKSATSLAVLPAFAPHRDGCRERWF